MVCGSKLYECTLSKLYHHGRNKINVRCLGTYSQGLRGLLIELAHFFRIGIADIIAEYTEVCHAERMQEFVDLPWEQRDLIWRDLRLDVCGFHKSYDPDSMKKHLDTNVSWQNVIQSLTGFFHGTYLGMAALCMEQVHIIFDNAVMISLCSSVNYRRECGCQDFADYLFGIILSAFPGEDYRSRVPTGEQIADSTVLTPAGT